MTSFPPELLLEKNFLLHPDPFLWLIEIRNPNDGPLFDPQGEDSILRLTPNREEIEFGSNPDTGDPLKWRPWNIEFGQLVADSEGNVNLSSIQLDAAMGTLWKSLRDNDWLRDHVVIFRLVHRSHLQNPNAQVPIRGTVVDVGASYQGIELQLAGFNLMNFEIPVERLGPNCGHNYRDELCAFSGDPGNVELGDCDLTFEACKLRGEWEENAGLPIQHPKNFGGARNLRAGAARRA